MELTHKENELFKSFEIDHCTFVRLNLDVLQSLIQKGLVINVSGSIHELTNLGDEYRSGNKAYEVEIPDRHKIRMDYLANDCDMLSIITQVNELIMRDNLRNGNE